MTDHANIAPTDVLGFFLAQMATKDTAEDRVELFMNAVREADGDWIDPAQDGGRVSHLVEVQLYGIHHAGATAIEAVANWVQVATEVIERRAEVGAAELIVLGDINGCPDEMLRAAAETVRLHSQDVAALARARWVETNISRGTAA